MTYKIGDKVWYARAGQTETQIVCPDCAGTKRIRLILANEEQVSIECGGCRRGYDGSSGTITEYKFKAIVKEALIDGVEETREKTTYRINASDFGYYSLDACDVFETEEVATLRVRELIKEAVDEERDRLLNKEKDTRTWAWNASYHRRAIKQAEKDLAYHTTKLNIAASKAKEDKIPLASGE